VVLGEFAVKIKDVVKEGIFSKKPVDKTAAKIDSGVQHWAQKFAQQPDKTPEALKSFVASITNAPEESLPDPVGTDPTSVQGYLRIVLSSYYNQSNTPPSQTAAVTDIRQTVPAGSQYRFPNPEPNANNNIIIRQDGYYVDRIPKQLIGRVKKVNGLYPVQRQENIDKFNKYYDLQADRGLVREEPIHAL
jgi:hypothetical protein